MPGIPGPMRGMPGITGPMGYMGILSGMPALPGMPAIAAGMPGIVGMPGTRGLGGMMGLNMPPVGGDKDPFYRTMMCQFYGANNCWFGDNCYYAHKQKDLRPLPKA